MPFTDCTLKVGMQPLRAALLAVVAHADRPKLGDEDHALSRVRWIAGKDELLVAATSSTDHGSSSAYAAVRIEDDDRTVKFDVSDGPLVVDVHPTMVRDLIRALRPAKGDDGEPEGWAQVRLDAAAGVIEARTGNPKPFVPGRGLLTRFVAAEKAFEAELEARPTGTAESSGWVVICGDQFAGAVESFHKAGNSLKARDKRWQAHLERAGVGQLKAV